MKNINRNWVYTMKFIEEKIYIITNRFVILLLQPEQTCVFTMHGRRQMLWCSQYHYSKKGDL